MLKRRLERLEKGNIDRQQLLVIINGYIGPSGWFEPVIGYQIGDEQMLRKDGETDEELEDRACVAIRAQAPRDAQVLVLNPINEELQCKA